MDKSFYVKRRSQASVQYHISVLCSIFYYITLTWLGVDRYEESKEKYLESAKMYEKTQALQPSDRKFSIFAATAYVDGHDFNRAGALFYGEGEFENAGNCWRRIKQYKMAADAYFKADILSTYLHISLCYQFKDELFTTLRYDVCCAGELQRWWVVFPGKTIYCSVQQSEELHSFRYRGITNINNNETIYGLLSPLINWLLCYQKHIYNFSHNGALHYHRQHKNNSKNNNKYNNEDKTIMCEFVNLFSPIANRRKFLSRYLRNNV